MTTPAGRSAEHPRVDPTAIWRRALELLRDRLGQQAFETWFAGTRAIELRGGVLHIGVPTAMKQSTLKGTYHPHLMQAVREAAGRKLELELRVAPPEPPAADSPLLQGDAEAHNPRPNGPVAQAAAGQRPVRTRPVLDPRLTFGRFLEGRSNQMAAAAARQVAQNPGRGANPLFIYSDSGLGKTHLCQAIAHECVRAGRYVIYISAENFLRQFLDNMQDRRAFQEKFESAEALIIDDIQALGGKTGTQDEFFNIFNALHSQGRQICITSDVPPRRLQGLQERLVTRMEGGLAVQITPPELELRAAILQQWQRDLGLALDDASLQLLAEAGGSNMRSMYGVLERVKLTAEIEQRPVTPALIQRATENYVQQEQPRRNPTVAQLIAAVSEVTGVSPEQITGSRKVRRSSRARQFVMYLATEHTDLSLAQIGEELGGRDHSTVSHGRDEVQKRLDNPDLPNADLYVRTIAEVRSRLNLFS